MNRLNELFERKKENILSVYFTAGYPRLDDTCEIIHELEKNGADLIEIGMPFSDPLADGPVIQKSSQIALQNGMSIKYLFEQLEKIRNSVSIPLLLMGYINPVMQYGIEKFCAKCHETGIDGLILPDLPLDLFIRDYKTLFDEHKLHNISLITPQTSEERIRYIDQISTGFIYMVSSASTTGTKTDLESKQIDYFNTVKNLKLVNPVLIGFGISNHETYSRACNYANGVIVGTAFINTLENRSNIGQTVKDFVDTITKG